MKKQLISLFAACSMITSATAGLVQTAYAAENPNIRIVVSDGATDDKKVLNFFYDVADGVDGVNTIQGNLTFSNENVTIDSITVTITNDMAQNNPATGLVSFTAYTGTSSPDGSFATVNVTVPTDVDITATYTLEVFEDTEYDDHASTLGAVTATIPKKAAAITPAAVTAVDKQPSVTGTGEFETQTADIYGVEITPNDESVTGAKVTIGEKSNELDFGTVYSGEGTVVFAVILASESGAALPTLVADNVTPITANVE